MIRIDVDTRCWQIPKEEYFLGVESDDKVKILQFELSKNEFCDGLNFTDCNCFINYKNEDNDTIPYGITDMEVHEDGTVTFTWKVSRGATIFKGNTFAVLCAKKVREDGTITNEWNSRIGSFTVSKGLEPSSSIVEVPEIDIISQLLLVAQHNIDQSSSLLEKAEGLGYLKEDFDVLKARMDQFTSLQEGSTTGDAELIDGRIGYDGTVYGNIGGAIREQVSELKSDITQCEEYAGIEYPEIEPVEGKYYLSTSQASSNSLSHSQILVLHKNDKIVIECCAYLNLANTIPALVRFNTIDSANPNGTLVQGSYEYETYSYTATDETHVAFNWRNETGYKVKIYRYQWETVDMLKDGYNILTDFVEVSPGYIQSSNGNATGTNRKHTELFALRYGETIEISASGYATGIVSILHRYDSDGLNLGPVYAPEESGQKVYCYTETKAIGYYKASSYSEILVIKKYSSPEGIREAICNTKAYERDYLKLLFENAIFIGDSLTRGVLGTTGSINNRISYPYYVGKMTGWNITNAGHGGYTTIQFWKNDLKTLNFTDKDVCFIFLGQNGGFTDTLEDDTTISDNQTYEDYAETNTGCYCKIIEYIKEQNPNIHIFILMGGGANATTVLPQIAEKYHFPCLNIYENQYFYMRKTKVYHPYKSDGVSRDIVHFGKIGYIDLAKSVLNMTFDYIDEHLEDYEYPYPS